MRFGGYTKEAAQPVDKGVQDKKRAENDAKLAAAKKAQPVAPEQDQKPKQ